MKYKNLILSYIVLFAILLSFSTETKTDTGEDKDTLKGAFEGKFYIGAGLNTTQINGRDSAVWSNRIREFFQLFLKH